MSKNIFSDKSLFIKIMHIILGIITIIISIVKKEKILAIIDLAIIIVVSGIFIYLMNL